MSFFTLKPQTIRSNRWSFSNLPTIGKTILILVILLFSTVASPAGAHGDLPESPDGFERPAPPTLPDPEGAQRLYRIDPSQSKAQYGVQETYVGGIEGKWVVGETSAISGDILVDWNNPMFSQLGMITVNVEQLTSDSRQRDRQLRNGYLESSIFPEVTFIPEPRQVFPAQIVAGESVAFTLHGFLTVRDTTILSDWEVELTLEEDFLTGRATTEILMSDFGVGPISIVGLLKTEDKMELTFDFVAVSGDGPIGAVPNNQSNTEPVLTESELKFSDVQPILEAKCVSCHVTGELGHSIFPMETAGDVTDYAGDIALVVETGFMPPWPPSNQTPEFLHDRSLTDAEVDTLLEWLRAGAPSDVPAETPLEDNSPPGIAVREDIRLTMSEPYVPAGDLEDDYRCFLLDPELVDGGYVTASAIVPDQRQVAHHAFLFQVSGDLREVAAEKSAQDSRYGWECYGDTGLTNGDPGAIVDSLSTWVPGAQPVSFRDGTGIFVEPGNLLVLQIHYNYSADFLPDQSSIVLQVEPASADLAPVRGIGLMAPVELHCPPGIDTPQCDRDTVLGEAGAQFGFLAYSNLVRCGQTAEDYLDLPVDDIVAVCDNRIPVDGKIVQVGGHMHTLGKRLQVTLNPDGPNPIILQDIPVWDFNWQGSYQLAEPIEVSEGDILRITCVHDNSAETDPEKARFIIYSEGTDDEMCLTVVKVEPTAEYAHLTTNDMLAGSIATVPEWVPTSVRLPAFILSLVPTGAYIGLLAVICLIGWLIVRRRRNRALLLQA